MMKKIILISVIVLMFLVSGCAEYFGTNVAGQAVGTGGSKDLANVGADTAKCIKEPYYLFKDGKFHWKGEMQGCNDYGWCALKTTLKDGKNTVFDPAEVGVDIKMCNDEDKAYFSPCIDEPYWLFKDGKFHWKGEMQGCNDYGWCALKTKKDRNDRNVVYDPAEVGVDIKMCDDKDKAYFKHLKETPKVVVALPGVVDVAGTIQSPYDVLLGEYKDLCPTCTENKLHNSIRFSSMVASDTARAYHLNKAVDKSSVPSLVNSVYFGFVNKGVPMKEQARRQAQFLLWESNQMSGLLNLDLSNDAALKLKLEDINFKGGYQSWSTADVDKKFGGKDNKFFTDGSTGGQGDGKMPNPLDAGKGAAGSQGGAAGMGLGCVNSVTSYGGAPIGGSSGDTGDKSGAAGGNPWVMPESDGSFNKAKTGGGDCNTLAQAINWDGMNKGGQAEIKNGKNYYQVRGGTQKTVILRDYETGNYKTFYIEVKFYREGATFSDSKNGPLAKVTLVKEGSVVLKNTYKEGIKENNVKKVESVTFKDSTGTTHTVDLSIKQPKKPETDSKSDPNADSGDGKSAYQKFSESCGGKNAQSCIMGGIASMAKDKEGESCGKKEGGQSTSGNTCACNALGMLGQPGGSGGFNSLACKKGISAAGMSLLPGAPGSGLLNNPAICSYGPCGGIVIVYVDPTTTQPSDFMEGGAFASVNVDASAQQAIPGSQN